MLIFVVIGKDRVKRAPLGGREVGTCNKVGREEGGGGWGVGRGGYFREEVILS